MAFETLRSALVTGAVLTVAASAHGVALQPGDVLAPTKTTTQYDVSLPCPACVIEYETLGIVRPDGSGGVESVFPDPELALDVSFRRIRFAPDGDVWTRGYEASLHRLDRATGARTMVLDGVEFPVRDFDFEADGRIAFLDLNRIHRLDPETGSVTPILDVPRRNGPGELRSLVVGPDGFLYVFAVNRMTESYPKILRVDPQTGAWTEIADRGLLDQSRDLLFDSSGRLLVLSRGPDLEPPMRILEVDPTTGAQTPLAEVGWSEQMAEDLDGTIVLDGLWDVTRVDLETGAQSTLASLPVDVSPNFSGVAVVPLPEPSAVEISVTPSTPLDVVHLASPVPLAVAVLGSDEVDVTGIAPSTVAVGPGGALPLADQAGLPQLEDVNTDGHTDLVLRFRASEMGLALGDDELCLDGVLDRPFRACAAVAVQLASCAPGGELAIAVPALLWLRRRGARRR